MASSRGPAPKACTTGMFARASEAIEEADAIFSDIAVANFAVNMLPTIASSMKAGTSDTRIPASVTFLTNATTYDETKNDARSNLSSLPLVKEGCILQQKAHEVAIANAVLETATEDGPRHDVRVDKRKTDYANPCDHDNFLVDAVLEFFWRVLGRDFTIIARCSIEVVDELTKDDAHQRERSTGGASRECSYDEKKNVDPCRVGIEEKFEVGEERA
ncbi:hypothetical protein HG531_000322 [Fusarium graminearum]|nr:hypothetical protein HG531_000322 [Fusarium graminearum]